eukprot:437120-Rhodomonas_salina.3
MKVLALCEDTRGASICEHNTRRARCKDCGGSSICEHKRHRTKCKDCGRSSQEAKRPMQGLRGFIDLRAQEAKIAEGHRSASTEG